jgi:hypothetical protein
MKRLIKNLLGWNKTNNYSGNIIEQQQYVRTTHPDTYLTQDEWISQFKVSHQFTFMDMNHYTEAVVNVSV